MNLIDTTTETSEATVKYLLDLTTIGTLPWKHEPDSDSGRKFIAIYDGFEITIEPFDIDGHYHDIYISKDTGESRRAVTFVSADWKKLFELVESKFAPPLPPWNPDSKFIDFISGELKLGTTKDIRRLYEGLYKSHSEEYMASKNSLGQ